MAKKIKLLICFLLMANCAWIVPAALATSVKPAIILAAFGTSTDAFATYDKIDKQVKEHYPGYDVRWAFTSRKVAQKVKEEQHKELKDLATVLQELKKAGYTKVAIQTFLLAPGKEWERVMKQSREIPGIKVVVGKPLLSSKADQQQVLDVVSKEFPGDLQKNAVILVGHGSPDPKAQASNNAFAQILHSRYPKNVFFGMVEFEKPGKEEVLQEVKKTGAASVKIIPFLLVAGDHAQNDILGNDPESWKSELMQMGKYQIDGVRQGLGDNPDIIKVYLTHLAQAMKSLDGGK